MSDASTVYVTLVRPGKQGVTLPVPAGSSVRAAFEAAGISEADFQSWSITDESGVSLTLSSTLNRHTTLICGRRVDGAVA